MTMHQPTSHWLLSKLSATVKFVQLNHPAYSPDLAPSDYFLIRNLKYDLRGTGFIDDESLTIAVEAWFESISGHKQLKRKLKKNALMLQENVEK